MRQFLFIARVLCYSSYRLLDKLFITQNYLVSLKNIKLVRNTRIS